MGLFSVASTSDGNGLDVKKIIRFIRNDGEKLEIETTNRQIEYLIENLRRLMHSEGEVNHE